MSFCVIMCFSIIPENARIIANQNEGKVKKIPNLIQFENSSQSKISKSGKNKLNVQHRNMHLSKSCVDEQDTNGNSYTLTLNKYGPELVLSCFRAILRVPHLTTNGPIKQLNKTKQGFSNIVYHRRSLFVNCLREPPLLHEGVTTCTFSSHIDTDFEREIYRDQFVELFHEQ